VWEKGKFPRRTAEQRFWAKVNKGQDCWVWTGSTSNGYGKFGLNGKVVNAHRYSYFLAHGRYPDDQVDHICHNRSCVNPEHLRDVTGKQNRENRAGAQSNSLSGIRGVRRRGRDGKWEARARHHGRAYFGGVFSTPEEAETAAIELRNRLFTHNVEAI